jgi:P-type Cu2+ transporter
MTKNNLIKLPVTGMESEHCALIVDKTLAKDAGILSHKVELNNRQALIEIDESKTSLDKVVASIRDVGYDVPTVKKSYPVTGMTCASCAVSAESIVKSQPGVIHANANFANTSLQVEFVPDIISPSQIKQAVQSIGYDIILDETNAQGLKEEAHKKHYLHLKSQVIWSSVFAFPTVLIGMFFMDMPYANWIMMFLTAPVLFWFGKNYFINAWKQAKHFSSNMDTLVALSTGVAFIFSVFNTIYPQFWHQRGLHPHVYFEAAAVVIAFISLGKLLEEKAKSNTSSAIKKLMGMQPRTVRIVHGDHEMEIPVSEVQVGQVISVKPGEKVAVDGEVVSGSTYIDESMISGEPVAVLKEKGLKVFAGTINQKGSIHFEAKKVGADTLLAQIIKMVQDAQGSKAPVQKLVDKISAIFVPVVIIISILTFVIWSIFGGENAFTQALLTSVTVLVIACPCALGLATPTAIMVGVGKGAEQGILIKDAESLELAYKTQVIILDKTGTITEGKPSVTALKWSEGVTSIDKQVFFSIENKSEHPLAQAIVEHFTNDQFPLLDFQHFESITGKGVEAIHEHKKYFVGSPRLMDEKGLKLSPDLDILASDWQKQAKTVIFFSNEKEILAAVAIEDKIKETSRQAIAALQDRGLEVYMLTGDNAATASAVVSQVGVKHFKAETLPSEKAAFIKELQAQGKIVAMVGDGINDSHALAQADVSIAMGKGSDIAMDVAKMTLISSDLNSLPKALSLSRQTIQTIRQNLFWAFIYNLIGIPIAAGILYPFNGFLLNPMLAGAAMAFSSVSVVSNSILLKFRKLA